MIFFTLDQYIKKVGDFLTYFFSFILWETGYKYKKEEERKNHGKESF